MSDQLERALFLVADTIKSVMNFWTFLASEFSSLCVQHRPDKITQLSLDQISLRLTFPRKCIAVAGTPAIRFVSNRLKKLQPQTNKRSLLQWRHQKLNFTRLCGFQTFIKKMKKTNTHRTNSYS